MSNRADQMPTIEKSSPCRTHRNVPEKFWWCSSTFPLTEMGFPIAAYLRNKKRRIYSSVKYLFNLFVPTNQNA